MVRIVFCTKIPENLQTIGFDCLSVYTNIPKIQRKIWISQADQKVLQEQICDAVMLNFMFTKLREYPDCTLINPVFSKESILEFYDFLSDNKICINQWVWVDEGDFPTECAPIMAEMCSRIQRVKNLEDANIITQQVSLKESTVHLVRNPNILMDCANFLISINVSISSPIDTSLVQYSPLNTNMLSIKVPTIGQRGVLFKCEHKKGEYAVKGMYILFEKIYEVDVVDDSIYRIFDQFYNYPCGYFGLLHENIFYINGISTFTIQFGLESFLREILLNPYNNIASSTGSLFGKLYVQPLPSKKKKGLSTPETERKEKQGLCIFVPKVYTAQTRSVCNESFLGFKNDQKFIWKDFWSAACVGKGS